MALQSVLPAFVWGAGGRRLTPEQIAEQRQVLDALAGRTDTSPVGHWSQGAARVVDAFGERLQEGRLDRAAAQNSENERSVLAGLNEVATGLAQPQALASTGGYAGGNPVASALMGGGSSGLSSVGKASAASAAGVSQNQANNDPIGLASSLLGRGEVPDRRLIQDYLATGGVNLDPATTAWCAAFVNATLGQSGIEGTGSNLARSFLNWGEAVDTPQRGDLAVFSRGDPNGWQGHVGFFDSFADDGRINVLGGNQSNSVSIAPYNSNSLLGFRRASPSQANLESMAVGDSMPMPVQTAQVGGIDPRIMQALTDPYVSPQTRSVAEALYSQSLSSNQAAAQRAQELADRDEGRAYSRWETADERNYQAGLLADQRGYDRTLRNEDFAREDARFAITDSQNDRDFALREQNSTRTTDISEYEYARQNGFEGSFTDFQLANRRAAAPSVTTNVGEGDKFYQTLDTKNAETFSALSETGVQARARFGQIERLDELLQRAPQGAAAMLKQAAGEYGINTEGLSDIQAAQALINELVPQQRQPGSGPMSDADLALYKASLPRLINQPEGNRLIVETMRNIANYQVQMGDIADLVADREISPAEARTMIRDLANPLENFREQASEFDRPSSPPLTSSMGGGEPARSISSREEYNSLPSGATFIAPDGSTRRKP